MPISNPGGYHWPRKFCTSNQTSIIHSHCSWISPLVDSEEVTALLVEVSWGSSLSSEMAMKSSSISIPRTVESTSPLASAPLASIFRNTCFAYLTSGGQFGSHVGFLTLWSWENFRRVEVPVQSLSGNFSLCLAATHSHLCNLIGRWLKTESNNYITLLRQKYWPQLCRL